MYDDSWHAKSCILPEDPSREGILLAVNILDCPYSFSVIHTVMTSQFTHHKPQFSVLCTLDCPCRFSFSNFLILFCRSFKLYYNLHSLSLSFPQISDKSLLFLWNDICRRGKIVRELQDHIFCILTKFPPCCFVVGYPGSKPGNNIIMP